MPAISDTLLGHPKGLFVCFMTELWERFAYYGMLSLLILYLTKIYSLSDPQANKIVAAYGALVWMLPVIGGILADRYLGSRKAVTVGAALMALGFFTISFPAALEWLFGADGESALTPLFFSMAIIVTGVGCLKSNISTVVGALYERDDPRRDSGFTTFYMGINIGGALGPIVCGGLGHVYGIRYGFSAAGAGMLIAMLTFLYGQRFLGGRADPPDPERLRQSLLGMISREWIIYLCMPLAVLLIWQALQAYAIIAGGLLWFSAVLGLFIIYFSLFRCEARERDRMLVVTILITFAVLFWSLYMQMFGSLTLFSDRLVDRQVLGTEVAASQLTGLPSVLVIIFAPLLGMLWYWLGKQRRNPNIPIKFAMSLVLVGIAFTMPALGRYFSDVGDQISLFWFLMVFVLMVLGELCQAPVSMNMISRLCPVRVVGMMMGAYFVSLAVGSIIAGELSARYTQVAQNADGSLVDPAAALAVYAQAFSIFGFIAIAVGALLFILAPALHRRMHGND